MEILEKKENIRNIAIIAHVDHGKTTLVDELLKQSGTFRNNEIISSRVMDNNDLEKERGITILSKNTSVFYKDIQINIVDTPGHADFSGEVERILKMVDGAILLIDAYEGVMPQTKFVLQKALSLNLSIIVCINKIDKPNATPNKIINEVLELFIDLNATNDQLNCPFIFTSAKEGYAINKLNDPKKDMTPLFDCIIKNINCPTGDENNPLQLLISASDYNDYVGRIGIGKISNGKISINDEVLILNYNDKNKKYKLKITSLYKFVGLEKKSIQTGVCGQIVAFSGIENLNIGDTLCDINNPIPIPFQDISKPTIFMIFKVNNSPFAGTEGKFITSRQIRERLFKELNTDVSLKVEDTENPEEFKVSGRGELHLSVLIENMRREGYEFLVSKASVLYKYDNNNQKLEPMESLFINIPDEFSGIVIQKLTQRKGTLLKMHSIQNNYTRLEFLIPARGLIGYRSEFLTDTKGNGIINSSFNSYQKFTGDITYRKTGSLIAFEQGEAVTYGLFAAQERGILFISPGEKVYAGMIVGQNSKQEDIEINVCKTKHLTNTRASSADEALRLYPPKKLSLEQYIDYINLDEYLEVTPKSLRIRKKILDHKERKRKSR